MSEVTNRAARLRLTLAVSVVCVCLATSRARAQTLVRPDSAPPYLAVSQYQHDRWTTANGLPNHAIDWIARTPDGYLWLGSEGGLVRFDGVRFTAFDRNNTPALRGTDFYPTIPYLVDRRGVLWIATSRGFVRYQDGEFTAVADSARWPGSRIQRMVEDGAGRLWVWDQDLDGRVSEIRDGRLAAFDPQSGLPTHVTAVATDPGGDVWVVTLDGGLITVHDGRAVPVLRKDAMPSGVTRLCVARDGAVWVGTQRGFGRVERGHFEFHPLGEGGLAGYVSAFAEDATGDIWIGTMGMGVLRWHKGQLERFDRRDGLSRDYVTSLLIDGEGSVWVGTRGGLDRLRRGAVATFTPRNGGPPFADPGALLWDRRGRFVVAGVTNSLVTGLPGAWAPLPEAEVAPRRKILTIAQGKTGIWVGGDDTLTLYNAGAAPRSYTARDGLTGKGMLAVVEDSLDRVWVGTNEGLFRLTQGRVRAVTAADGLPHAYVRALIVDRRGAVWAGTNNGVARIVGDSVRGWVPAGSLAGPIVFTIREIADGSIWIGTSGGLTRVRDGTLASIRAEQGLPGEMVSAIEETEDDLWINTGSGISRVPLSELNAVADGRAARVHATTFGTRDGLPATEIVVGATPLSARTPDGRLWFSTAGGLAVVDPRHMPRNPIAPRVHIEELSADGVRLTPLAPTTAPVRVPPRTGRLTLRYTATSLLLPDRVRFRYQLVGYDRAWVDAPSTQRVVSYTNLRPGPYTFRVIAANDAGVWNLDGAWFSFAVAPAFYQTIWFLALCVAALVVVFFTLHRARVRQLEQQLHLRSAAALDERTRVARELHDTLLQGFGGIILQLAAVHNSLPANAAESSERLTRVLSMAEETLRGARQAIWDMRTPELGEHTLADALEGAARGAIGDMPVQLSFAVRGDRRRLEPRIESTILRIGREAVINAVRHGRPRAVEVDLRYDDRHVDLFVRDDGRGFDATDATAAAANGHWGVRGMYERAARACGSLEINGRVGQGTQVALSLPTNHG